MSAVEVEGLAVRYGAIRAVDDVSFVVEPGQTVALLGPNGAGKTTTVDAIVGYRRPDGGRVRVFGLDPVADAGALRQRIGFMPQSGGIYPGIRPLEALQLFAAYYDRPEDPASLLERVGLAHRASSTYRRLSGGEQQRLSLALALVGRPAVALLDEPTAGVDVEGRRSVRELIAGLHQAGVTVLLTTHDLEEAERLADRIVIVDRGVVVADGTPSELLASEHRDEFTFSAPAGLDTAALGRTLNAFVDCAGSGAGEYRVAAPPTPGNVAALTSWLAEHDVALGDLRAGRQRLEDVFLRLTGDDR